MKQLKHESILQARLQIATVAALGYLLIAFSGCAPVFSEMQSAKLVGKGNVSFLEDAESDHVQNHLGAQAAYGVAEGVDLRARVEYIWLEDISATVIGVGPKFSIWKGHIAGYVPLGFAIGEDIQTSESWQVHPTMLFTVPVTQNIEFNPSVKYLINLSEDTDNLAALNLGLGLSNDLQKYVIRPEYGFLFNPGESGIYRHFSVGITLYPGSNL